MYSVFKKSGSFFLLILIIQSNVIKGQGNEFMVGKLIEYQDKTPIPFATVLIKNKAKGLISNIDGGFKIPYGLQKSGDTLVISSIGYSSKEILLSSLQKNIINLITLVRKTEVLDEVIIIGSKERKKAEIASNERKNAEEIVGLALDKISENYPFIPFSYVGYYRDYQINEGKYLNLNEALMQVFDSGFGAYDFIETQTRIYQNKKNPTFPTDTIAAKPYDYTNKKKVIAYTEIGTPGGNEYTLLRLHDAIRNYNINSYDFVNRLDSNFVENHKLKLLTDTYVDDIPLYSIDINKTLENIIVTGKIFISKGDFKIYKLQYTVYDKRKSARHQKRANVSKIKEKDHGLLYEIIVEYQSHKGIMYPNYISFNNSFESLQPAKFSLIDVEVIKTKLLKLTFNNTPILKDAIKKRNYELWYDDTKLKIESIEVEKNIVLLYLKKEIIFNSRQLQSTREFIDENEMTKLVRSSNGFVDENVITEVKNVRDIYGNLIHFQEYKSYNQYREFFVQELLINYTKPLDALYMLKNEPVFMNQPIAPFKNLQDYWMNTPLKN